MRRAFSYRLSALSLGGLLLVADFGTTDWAAAREALQGKSVLPTALSSAEISASFSAELKARSFYSATVTSARVLEELKTETQSVMNLLSPIDGIVSGNDLASAVTRLQSFFERAGYVPPEGVERGSIRDLASTTRINLILNQNTRTAYATANYQQMMEPEQKELFPYLRYLGDPRPTQRAEHWALNGLVLSKDDPFWATHTPPWDYNCWCDVEEVAADEAEQKGVDKAVVREGRTMVDKDGRAFEVFPAESGYTFDPRASLANGFDAGIDDAAIREQFEAVLSRNLDNYVKQQEIISDELPSDRVGSGQEANLRDTDLGRRASAAGEAVAGEIRSSDLRAAFDPEAARVTGIEIGQVGLGVKPLHHEAWGDELAPRLAARLRAALPTSLEVRADGPDLYVWNPRLASVASDQFARQQLRHQRRLFRRPHSLVDCPHTRQRRVLRCRRRDRG